MSSVSADMTKFLKALDNVKKDFTCGVCSNICNDPVTLSVCFHMICAEHFEGLKNCPTCNVSLKNCKTFIDEGLRDTIPTTKALDDLFKGFRVDKENLSTSRANTTKSQNSVKKRRAAQSKDIIDMLENVPTQSSKQSTAANTNVDTNKRTTRAKSIDISCTSLKGNKTLEKRNIKGETALHVACRLGKMDKIVELLNQGANTNTKDNAGWTPIHEAVQNGQIEIVKLLLQHNALINVPGQSNETPLHEAVRYKHKEIAELLVRNGADISIRNIKGETPVQLADEDMKQAILNASEDIIQTQSVNITHISTIYEEMDYEDIRVYLVSQFRTVENQLKVLVKHHSNVHIEAKFTKKVTHLIVDTEDLICTSSLDVLQGIVNALWILSSDWITKSTKEKLEPFEKYEVVGVGTKNYNGPKNARYNKYKQLPGIFNGCHFYLHDFIKKHEITKEIVLTKANLSKLLTDADGIVLRRAPNPESIPESEKLVPYHARKGGKLENCGHYIIFKDMYEPMYNMSHLKALPIGWLIECIEKYELCEPW